MHRSNRLRLQEGRTRATIASDSEDERLGDRSDGSSDRDGDPVPRPSHRDISSSTFRSYQAPPAQAHKPLPLPSPLDATPLYTFADPPSSSALQAASPAPSQPSPDVPKRKQSKKRGKERPKKWAFRIEQYQHEPPSREPQGTSRNGIPAVVPSAAPAAATPRRKQHPASLSKGQSGPVPNEWSGATAISSSFKAPRASAGTSSIPLRAQSPFYDDLDFAPADRAPSPPAQLAAGSSRSLAYSTPRASKAINSTPGPSHVATRIPRPQQLEKNTLQVFIEDRRTNEKVLSEALVRLSERDSSLWVDAAELVDALQDPQNMNRIGGACKAFVMRDDFRQNFLVVEPNGTVVARPQNLQVKEDRTLRIYVEAHSPTTSAATATVAHAHGTTTGVRYDAPVAHPPTPISSDASAHGSPPPVPPKSRKKRPRMSSPSVVITPSWQDSARPSWRDSATPRPSRSTAEASRHVQPAHDFYDSPSPVEFGQADTGFLAEDAYQTSLDSRPAKRTKRDASSSSESYPATQSINPMFSVTRSERTTPFASEPYPSLQANTPRTSRTDFNSFWPRSQPQISAVEVPGAIPLRQPGTMFGLPTIPSFGETIRDGEFHALSSATSSREQSVEGDDEDDIAPEVVSPLFTPDKGAFPVPLDGDGPAGGLPNFIAPSQLSIPIATGTDYADRMPLAVSPDTYVRPADSPPFTGFDAHLVAHIAQTMRQENRIKFDQFHTTVEAGRGLSNEKLVEWYRWVRTKIDKYAHAQARAPESCGRIPVEAKHVLGALTLTEAWYTICRDTLRLLALYGVGGTHGPDPRVVEAERSRVQGDGRLGSERWTELLILLHRVDMEWTARQQSAVTPS